MLTFLRKIRKSLIGSGSARKYLLYAIGEILLVMIGILLALQVNNWNEWRKDRIIERKALQDLLQEFKSNKVIFDGYLEHKQVTRDEWIQFLNLIGDPTVSDSEKGGPRPRTGRNSFTPSMGMINSIMESDKIDKLENDSLRYWLSNWNDIIFRLDKAEEVLQEYLNNTFWPYEASLIPMKTRGTDYRIDSLELAKYHIGAYTDMNYVNLLKRNYHFIGGVLGASSGVDHAFSQIINLLEIELASTE